MESAINVVALVPLVGIGLIILGVVRRSKLAMWLGVGLVGLFVGASLVDWLVSR